MKFGGTEKCTDVPDCGERFEGNICTFCGRPVPQEELEQEKAIQEKSDEQENINNSEEVSKSAVENAALNSAGVQPVNEYAQNGYNTQPVNNYAQKNYNSQHSYGNPNYSNSAMPSGYTNQNQPFSDVVSARGEKIKNNSHSCSCYCKCIDYQPLCYRIYRHNECNQKQ